MDIFLEKNFSVIFDNEDNKGVYDNIQYGGDLIFAKDN